MIAPVEARSAEAGRWLALCRACDAIVWVMTLLVLVVIGFTCPAGGGGLRFEEADVAALLP
jgi:hypothetical protein